MGIRRNNRLAPMQIQSSMSHKSRGTFSIVDGGLVVCAVGTLLALLLVLDAYEYIIVPGASRVNGRTSQELDLIPEATVAQDNINDKVEEKSDVQLELEKAQKYIQELRGDLEKLSVKQVEAVAEKEGVDDKQLKADEEKKEEEEITTKDQDVALEEKIETEKEEVIEEIVEKEAGLDDWCPDCTWNDTGIKCLARLDFLKKRYQTEDVEGKVALMEQGCSSKNGQKKEERAVETKVEEKPVEVKKETAEKASGLDDWCPDCKWKGTGHDCLARLNWLKKVYNTEDVEGKVALMTQGCSKSGQKKNRREFLRG